VNNFISKIKSRNRYQLFDFVLLVVLILALTESFFHVFSASYSRIILIILTFLNLIPVLFLAVRSLLKRRISVEFLAGIALIFSILNSEWHSAAFISLMLVSARLFIYYTDDRVRSSVQSLLKLRPITAHLKIDHRIVDVPVEKLRANDLIVVDAGERIPVDGTIESGSAAVDQSSLTGESEPVHKTKGDEVLSSTLVAVGGLVIRASRVGSDTTFSKIVDLIEKSQGAKTPISSMVERFAGLYVIIILIIAAVAYFLSRSLSLTLSILLVTCADDIAVAVPLTFAAGIIAAAKKGIIIKGGIFLEGFSSIKAMVFDKTGTITEGKHKIQSIVAFNDYKEDEVLSYLGTLGRTSEHPTAKTIVRYLNEKHIPIFEADDIDEEPGCGIRGEVGGQAFFAGKLSFLRENGISFSSRELETIDKEKEIGRSLTILGSRGRAMGFISFMDTIRPQAAKVIDKLKLCGVERILMLTGDNEKVAAQIAKEAHIPEFKANLMPEDKINFLKTIIKPGFKVAMVGDGVNDAPSLTLADIGIAMGAIGTDAAIESADIVLMKDRMDNLLDLMAISRRTLKVVRQDFWIWGITNVVGLILVFGGVLNPSGAAAYNFLTDFLPLFNSLKLFEINYRR
jgi:Cd2+/Zn2+-exporting ATPase